MFSFFSPGINTAQHVSEVVSIAIGLNLLLPVASSFLKCLLDGIEIEPSKIIENDFNGRCPTPEDLTKIAVAAQEIELERSKCCPLSWRWWTADCIFAIVGILLLLFGWVDSIGFHCLWLFTPVVAAVVHSIWKYAGLKNDFNAAVKSAKSNSEHQKKKNSAFVKNYVESCSASISKTT
ncbi:MAG: hypothetical protein E7046_01025 [Lentisphaerae bacterium]|nr:hypothetical protein [Lentisphaerota bacterium]